MPITIVSIDVVDEKFLEKVFGKSKENLKTSPNKDFTAQSVSPKVCSECRGYGAFSKETGLGCDYGAIKCEACQGTGKPP